MVSFAVERLGDLLISEAKLLFGVVNQIKKVKRELERMECFLEEADKKQNRDKRVRQWVGEIRELAFKIEDLIETFAMEVAIKKQKSNLKKMLLRFSCIFREGVSRHNIATEIGDIKAELIDLTACLQTYGITKGLEEGETSNSLINLKSRRIFYSLDVEQDFVGMENEIKQVLSDLKKEDKSCKVVSIYGMGGLGKTTLAQKLYNHAEIKAHFEAFSWICITQKFDREKVLQGILKQLVHADREGEVSRMDDAKLVEELRKVQQEKKCLIVIDDIWTIDSWKSLEHAFLVREITGGGSKILLTTRNATVGEIGSIHKIQALSEKEGWQLFAKKTRIDEHSDNTR